MADLIPDGQGGPEPVRTRSRRPPVPLRRPLGTTARAAGCIMATTDRPKPAEDVPAVKRPKSEPAHPTTAGPEARRRPEPPPIREARPDSPRWFRPLAELTERSPPAALAALLGPALALFGAGLALGLLRR